MTSRKTLAALAAAGLFGTAAAVQGQVSSLDAPVTQSTVASAVAPYSDFAGSVTLAQLQGVAPASYGGRRVFVSDLGGGPGQVLSSGSCWRRLVGFVQPVVLPGAAAVNVTALAQSNVVQLTAPSSLLANVALNVAGACPGDVYTVYMPNGVLTAAGALGVSINGTQATTITGITSAYSADFLFTGSGAFKLRGGPVQ